MKRSLNIAALAIAIFSYGGIVSCGQLALAEDVSYSALEARLSAIEGQLTQQTDVQQVAYNGDGCACESSCSDCCGCDGCCCGDCCGCACDYYYAEMQFNFFRGHVLEGSIVNNSKLSEEYEWSPRFVLGYENCCGQGVRARYWHHGHHHNNLNAPGGVRFEMDVFDLELTKRISGCRTDVVLSGGFRGAQVGLMYGLWGPRTDLIGLTGAADVRTTLCCDCCSEWAAVYGGRLAILGGDIDGGPQGLVRDENWRVWELYAGVEHRCCRCGVQWHTRLAVEIQNWHMDLMTGETTPTVADQTSLGFVGPSFTVGAAF